MRSALVGVVVGLALPAGVARAVTGTETNAGHDGQGNVTAVASQDAVITQGSGGASACSWEWMTVGQVLALVPSQGETLTPEELAEHSQITIGGILYRLYAVYCPGFSTIRLVNPNITPGDLIDDITRYADDYIQLPEPLVNPPSPKGAAVNLGLWLAVEEASYEPITARAGLAWITVTPRILSTTFEFGNGDSVTCDGFGVPITDLDTVDEGPCGYTYRRPGDVTMTVTSTWELPYTSSTGPGALEPMQRTVTLPYRAYEIITTGQSG